MPWQPWLGAVPSANGTSFRVWAPVRRSVEVVLDDGRRLRIGGRDADVRVTVVDEGDTVYLETRLPEAFNAARVPMITGRDLERVRVVDAEFEERDGSPAVMDIDLVGSAKTDGQAYAAGPLAALGSGVSRTRVW
jgi:hypothetical protein